MFTQPKEEPSGIITMLLIAAGQTPFPFSFLIVTRNSHDVVKNRSLHLPRPTASSTFYHSAHRGCSIRMVSSPICRVGHDLWIYHHLWWNSIALTVGTGLG